MCDCTSQRVRVWSRAPSEQSVHSLTNAVRCNPFPAPQVASLMRDRDRIALANETARLHLEAEQQQDAAALRSERAAWEREREAIEQDFNQASVMLWLLQRSIKSCRYWRGTWKLFAAEGRLPLQSTCPSQWLLTYLSLLP